MNPFTNQRNYATIVQKVKESAEGKVEQLLEKSNDLAVKKIAPSVYKQGKARGRIEGAVGAFAIGTLLVGTYIGVRKYLAYTLEAPARIAAEKETIEHEMEEAVSSFKEHLHEANE